MKADLAILVVALLAACSSEKAKECSAIRRVNEQSGAALVKAGAKTDNMDPSLAPLVERYADALKAVPVKNADLSALRDAFAGAVEQTADATRAWQNAFAAKDVAGVAAAQGKLDASAATQAVAFQRLRAECAANRNVDIVRQRHPSGQSPAR